LRPEILRVLVALSAYGGGSEESAGGQGAVTPGNLSDYAAKFKVSRRDV
jgi:hypothetical protein